MDSIDPKRLTLPKETTRQPTQKSIPRHKPRGKFLKGPIAWIWLAEAAHLPGKTLHVGIALWHLVGLKRTQTIVLSGTVLKELGVNRHAGYRGLNALEQAGLVSVERHPGRCPVVTILEAADSV